MNKILQIFGETMTDVVNTIDNNTPHNSFFEGGGQLANILGWAFGLAGLVAVGIIIYGGYLWNAAQGDPGKVKQGTNTITYGIVGLIIVILGYAIANFFIAAVAHS